MITKTILKANQSLMDAAVRMSCLLNNMEYTDAATLTPGDQAELCKRCAALAQYIMSLNNAAIRATDAAYFGGGNMMQRP